MKKTFEVDIEETNFGVVYVQAENEQEAIEVVREQQTVPDEVFTGTKYKPIRAREAFS